MMIAALDHKAMFSENLSMILVIMMPDIRGGHWFLKIFQEFISLVATGYGVFAVTIWLSLGNYLVSMYISTPVWLCMAMAATVFAF